MGSLPRQMHLEVAGQGGGGDFVAYRKFLGIVSALHVAFRRDIGAGTWLGFMGPRDPISPKPQTLNPKP